MTGVSVVGIRGDHRAVQSKQDALHWRRSSQAGAQVGNEPLEVGSTQRPTRLRLPEDRRYQREAMVLGPIDEAADLRIGACKVLQHGLTRQVTKPFRGAVNARCDGREGAGFVGQQSIAGVLSARRGPGDGTVAAWRDVGIDVLPEFSSLVRTACTRLMQPSRPSSCAIAFWAASSWRQSCASPSPAWSTTSSGDQ